MVGRTNHLLPSKSLFNVYGSIQGGGILSLDNIIVNSNINNTLYETRKRGNSLSGGALIGIASGNVTLGGNGFIIKKLGVNNAAVRLSISLGMNLSVMGGFETQGTTSNKNVSVFYYNSYLTQFIKTGLTLK